MPFVQYTYTSSRYPHRLLFVNKQLNFKPEEVKHPSDVNVSQCTGLSEAVIIVSDIVRTYRLHFPAHYHV